MYSDYSVLVLDLSTPRTNVRFELPHTAKKMIVLKADSTAYIKINDIAKQDIYLYQNLEIELPINTIYITNQAGSGQVILLFLR